MLFWLFVIALLIGITLIILAVIDWESDKHPFMWYHEDSIMWSGICVTTTV